MNPVPYNRSLSGRRYILWVFTNKSLALLFGIELALLNFNIQVGLIFVAVFAAYQSYLRFGKPPGYDEHLAVSLVTPKVLRPGKLSVVPTIVEAATP